jgi:hypothetical protein
MILSPLCSNLLGSVIPMFPRGHESPARTKEALTSTEQPYHTPCMPVLRDLRLLRQRPGEHQCSFTQRFTVLYLRLPQVSEAQVVDAFRSGTTNLQMIEQLTLPMEPVTTARLLELAHECANQVPSEDSSSGPSRYGRPFHRYRSRSTAWHPSGTQAPGESEGGSPAHQE